MCSEEVYYPAGAAWGETFQQCTDIEFYMTTVANLHKGDIKNRFLENLTLKNRQTYF